MYIAARAAVRSACTRSVMYNRSTRLGPIISTYSQYIFYTQHQQLSSGTRVLDAYRSIPTTRKLAHVALGGAGWLFFGKSGLIATTCISSITLGRAIYARMKEAKSTNALSAKLSHPDSGHSSEEPEGILSVLVDRISDRLRRTVGEAMYEHTGVQALLLTKLNNCDKVLERFGPVYVTDLTARDGARDSSDDVEFKTIEADICRQKGESVATLFMRYSVEKQSIPSDTKSESLTSQLRRVIMQKYFSSSDGINTKPNNGHDPLEGIPELEIRVQQVELHTPATSNKDSQILDFTRLFPGRYRVIDILCDDADLLSLSNVSPEDRIILQRRRQAFDKQPATKNCSTFEEEDGRTIEVEFKDK